jgi:hypothetical protein
VWHSQDSQRQTHAFYLNRLPKHWQLSGDYRMLKVFNSNNWKDSLMETASKNFSQNTANYELKAKHI